MSSALAVDSYPHIYREKESSLSVIAWQALWGTIKLTVVETMIKLPITILFSDSILSSVHSAALSPKKNVTPLIPETRSRLADIFYLIGQEAVLLLLMS